MVKQVPSLIGLQNLQYAELIGYWSGKVGANLFWC